MDYISILTDPAHWMFELTVQLLVDGLLLGVGWRLGMRWVKRHDRRHHNHESAEDTAAAMAEVHAALEREVPCPTCGAYDPTLCEVLHPLVKQQREAESRLMAAIGKADAKTQLRLRIRALEAQSAVDEARGDDGA